MWKLEFSKEATKQIQKLDTQIQIRIRDAIFGKLIPNPDIHLIPLTADL